MNKKLIVATMLLLSCKTIIAQNNYPKYRIINGDTMPVIQMNEAVIHATRTFANDTLRYNFNQMKLYITQVMPYAQQGIKLFTEINEKTSTMSGKTKRDYVQTREREIKAQFEDKLKALNVTQGKYLVKIMNRQLNTTCYDMIKTLHNPIKARLYQIWGNAHGIDLNEYYNPNDNMEFESIVRGLGY